MKQWTQKEVKAYCIDRLAEIEMINHLSHTPSAFVCIASFICFLSELAYGKNERDNKTGEKYKDFIEHYLPKYSDYKDDLYATFRCGMVHSMTLYKQLKESRKLTQKVELPTVVLTHDLNYANRTEIQKYTKDGFNAIILFAFDLCEEIRAAIDVMFDPKDPNNPAYTNSVEYVKYQKPIGLLLTIKGGSNEISQC